MEESNVQNLEQTYSFALKRIQLLEKNLEIVAKKEDQDKYDFDINLKINVDAEKHLSIHMFSVKVIYKPDDKILASVSIICVFDIFNFEKLLHENGASRSLPQGLLNLLNTVVVGTMRGVMFSEFRGTALDNVVLPVLDPTRFQKSN
jgi:hypothetical protein